MSSANALAAQEQQPQTQVVQSGAGSGNPTATPNLPLPASSIPSATATTAPSFDLSHTIQLALKSSSELEIATRNLDRDAAAVDAAASAGRPKIATNDSYQHLDSPVAIKFGAGQAIIAEAQNKEFLAATASLPLDLSGQIRGETDVARLQLLSDRFQRDRIFNARVLVAQTIYFDLLRAEHQVDVARASLQDAQTQQDIAQRQFAGGVGQRIDFLRAQTQVATAQQSVLAALDNLTIQQSNFNDLLGRPLGEPVQAVDTPGVSTGTAVASNAADVTSIDAPVPTFYVPNTDVPVPLDRAMTTAQQARPELRADLVNLQAAEKQIQIARTGLAPTLSLNATGNYYPTTDFQTPRHSLGVFTANLSFPLYDGGLTRDRIREARDTAQNANTQLGSDRTDVELQVRQSYTNLTTAAQQIAAANAALQQAIAARRLAQVRYANGVGLYLEVTDAESALTQAENSQVNTVYNYLTARAQYLNAIGTPQLSPQI